MSKTISFSLSVDSINKAIKELKAYQKWVEEKKEELIKKLAEFGAQDIRVRMNGIFYEYYQRGVPFTPTPMYANVTVEKTEGGWSILANDDQICFVEFGAGVTYNGSESYPGERPPEIVGIGEYGYGNGRFPAWFVGDPKNGVYTYGIKAEAPLWHSAQDMKAQLTTIAKEVFSR